MLRRAAKGKALWPALMATVAALLGSTAEASLPRSPSRSELLAAPAFTEALASSDRAKQTRPPAQEPALLAPHRRLDVGGENLTSGLSSRAAQLNVWQPSTFGRNLRRVLAKRMLYTPYGEAHVEVAPELQRASFDQTLTSLTVGATPVQQTIANPDTAQPGAVRLGWTLPLGEASLATGAVLERRGAGGWAPVPESERWIGPHPEQPEQIVVLPMTGWEVDATYRIRLTTALKDRLNRSLPENHVIELAIPPPGTLGAPILDRIYPATFDSAAAAATTLSGAFPGGQTSLFQGLWTDPTTGIAYARARWYDARNATWLSEDPLGPVDSPNLYQAFGLDPQNNTDPLGLQEGEPTCVTNNNCVGSTAWLLEKLGLRAQRGQAGPGNPAYGDAADALAEKERQLRETTAATQTVGKVGYTLGDTAVHMAPGPGTVLALAEAHQDAQARHYGAAAVGVGLALLDVIPGAGEVDDAVRVGRRLGTRGTRFEGAVSRQIAKDLGTLARDDRLLARNLKIASEFTPHHLIMVSEAQKFPVMHRAAELGYNINRAENGLALPNTVERAMMENLPYHPGRGRHTVETYAKPVGERLRRLQELYDAGVVTDATLLDEVGVVENSIRRDVLSGDLRLNSRYEWYTPDQ